MSWLEVKMSVKLRRVLILGRPGVGKTRLAGTFPAPFFLQLEPDGCTTAFPGIPDEAILDIPMGPNSLPTLESALDQLLRYKPDENGLIELKNGYKAGTVVLDSIDAIQQIVADFDPALRNRMKWSYDEWGILLKKVRPINTKFQALPVHGVMVAHTRTHESQDGNKPGVMTLSVQGALGRELPRWFSCIMHIVEGARMKREVCVQPTIYNNYRVEAKDRHNLLKSLVNKNGVIELPADDDGYPEGRIAQVLCGASNGRQ